MHLALTGRHISVSDAYRDHVEQRLKAAVEKYFGDAIEVQVTVSKEGNRFRSDLSMHVGQGIYVKCHGEGGDAYAAFDDSAARAEKQLRRYKRRLKDHHNSQRERAERARQGAAYVLAADSEAEEVEETEVAQPLTIAETTTQIPLCTVGDAIMRMDLEGAPVMVFHNSGHGRINVVYRRPDGNIGWIDPKDSSVDIDAAD